MDAHNMGVFLLGGAGLAVVVWVLHKIGKALVAVAEAVVTVAVVFVALWLVLKGVAWLIKQIITHPRTAVTVAALLAWWHWLGWPSLAVTAGSVAVGVSVWRLVDVVSCDRWVGRRLRSWWQRWTVYAPKLPGWLHACGLSMKDDSLPVVVTVNLVGRKKVRRERQAATVRLPKVIGVKSGPSWDEVRVRLVPGQKPEDVDEATRALASARRVARCQVRELAPNVVSIDFQRRNLLAAPMACRDLTDLAAVPGTAVELGRVWDGVCVRPFTMEVEDHGRPVVAKPAPGRRLGRAVLRHRNSDRMDTDVHADGVEVGDQLAGWPGTRSAPATPTCPHGHTYAAA